MSRRSSFTVCCLFILFSCFFYSPVSAQSQWVDWDFDSFGGAVLPLEGDLIPYPAGSGSMLMGPWTTQINTGQSSCSSANGQGISIADVDVYLFNSPVYVDSVSVLTYGEDSPSGPVNVGLDAYYWDIYLGSWVHLGGSNSSGASYTHTISFDPVLSYRFRFVVGSCWASYYMRRGIVSGSIHVSSLPPTATSVPSTLTSTPYVSGWIPTALLPYCAPSPTPGNTPTNYAPLATLHMGSFPTMAITTPLPPTSTGTLTPANTATPSLPTVPPLTLTAGASTAAALIATHTPTPTPTPMCRPGRLEIDQPIVDIGAVEVSSEPSCFVLFPRIDFHLDPINLLVFTTPELDVDIRQLSLCIFWLRWDITILGINFADVLGVALAISAFRMMVGYIRKEL